METTKEGSSERNSTEKRRFERLCEIPERLLDGKGCIRGSEDGLDTRSRTTSVRPRRTWQAFPSLNTTQEETIRSSTRQEGPSFVWKEGEAARPTTWMQSSFLSLQGATTAKESGMNLDLTLELSAPTPRSFALPEISSSFSLEGSQGSRVPMGHCNMSIHPQLMCTHPTQGWHHNMSTLAPRAGTSSHVLISNIIPFASGRDLGIFGMGTQRTVPLAGTVIGEHQNTITPMTLKSRQVDEALHLQIACGKGTKQEIELVKEQTAEIEKKRKTFKRSPTQEMRVLLRLFNAIFTQDTAVGRDLNRYTEEQIKVYLTRLGLSVGKFPLSYWGYPKGQYKILSAVLSWILSAVHSKKGFVIVVSAEQAELAVPYRQGSPYVVDTAVLLDMGMLEYKWPLPLVWKELSELRGIYDYKTSLAPASGRPQVCEKDVMRILGWECLPYSTENQLCDLLPSPSKFQSAGVKDVPASQAGTTEQLGQVFENQDDRIACPDEKREVAHIIASPTKTKCGGSAMLIAKDSSIQSPSNKTGSEMDVLSPLPVSNDPKDPLLAVCMIPESETVGSIAIAQAGRSDALPMNQNGSKKASQVPASQTSAPLA